MGYKGQTIDKVARVILKSARATTNELPFFNLLRPMNHNLTTGSQSTENIKIPTLCHYFQTPRYIISDKVFNARTRWPEIFIT